jgi:thiopeptide-type bacteriocin biosynthesis protein
MKHMNNQDLYIPGDKWLYLRIYTGHKTADVLLTDILYPLSKNMIKKRMADAWFFVRYTDTDFHLRYRIRLKDEKYMAFLLQILNRDLKYFIDHRLVWKVEQGTYLPEKERYGETSMNYAEAYFYADSQACLAFLTSKIYFHDEDSLWLFAMLSMDEILNDFKFSLGEKKDLLLSLNRGFGREFGKDRFLAKQLSEKYRRFRIRIKETLDKESENDARKQMMSFLSERSMLANAGLQTILGMYDDDSMEVDRKDLVSSLVHMSMNRIFRNNNRLHEMILYDFLFRHYKSSVKCVVRNS